MNNPTRPLEASGTSGEKAAMNGVMHFSVLDGWWVEGYKKNAGWALPMERTYEDQSYQDELDAATIYAIIENEIAPDFYEKDEKLGYSPVWVSYVKNTVAQVALNFTTNRMLTDYVNQYYVPLVDRKRALRADDFKAARELAGWKSLVKAEWPYLEPVNVVRPDGTTALANEYHSEVSFRMNRLKPEDVGVEFLFATTDAKGKLHIAQSVQFECTEFKDGIAKYTATIVPDHSGTYQIAIRMYPKNPLLVSRQDCDLVRWL